MNLAMIKTMMVSGASATGFMLKKHAPEILIGTGIVGAVGSTVLACKATLRLEEVQADHENRIEYVKKGREDFTEEEYTLKEYQKDLTVTYTQSAMEYIKLYGPAVSLGILSIGSILAGYNVLNKRSLTYLAAAKSIEKAFNEYRGRVIEEFGEKKDFDFRHGIRQEKIKVTDPETGKKKTETVDIVDPNKFSQYSRFFDSSSRRWEDNAEYNLLTLKQAQNWANDRLHARKYLLLNEVYEQLDIPCTNEGAIVGWVVKPGNDNIVDFGIYDPKNAAARDFVNGFEKVILLDFNVDGVILDEIDDAVKQFSVVEYAR